MLYLISLIMLLISIIQFLIITIDIIKNHQSMAIMNIVWPLTGLYFPILGIIAYYKLGKEKQNNDTHHSHNKPFWQSVIISTTHCSAGCSLGNIIGAPIVFLTGLILFNNELATTMIIEFILAYIFGLMFQYFHMEIKHENPIKDLKNAIKADTLSLIAFEVGMFGFMIIAHLTIKNNLLEPNKIEYWFIMQIAMLIGFFTSYPINWYLVKKGIKHAM